MRWILATVVGLGAVATAGITPAVAAGAPGAAAQAVIPNTSQVEKVHRRWRGGGVGLYIGPSWGGYYGGDPYYGSSYYDDDYGYYPRYRYRRYYGGHRHYRHRHWRRHRH